MDRKTTNRGDYQIVVILVWTATLVCAPGVGVAQAQFLEPTFVLHTFPDDPVGGSFGWAVAELWDINNDGAMEAIISAPQGGVDKTHVYSGRTGELIYDLDPDPPTSRFGFAISDAGDVNNDGVHDIVVGGIDPAGTGRAFVFSGLNGSQIYVFNGEANGDNFGYGVGAAGDVDGDGWDDVLVGAPFNDVNGNAAGRVYIFSGQTGNLIRTLEGEDAGDNFGSGTAGTGDIDGDGIGDQIVGAMKAGPSADGRAYVFSGATGQLIFPPINAPLTAQSYGQFFVAGVGDVNNDGTRDVYVADFADNGNRGRAFVYSGVNGDILHEFVGGPGEGVGPGRGAGDVDNDGFADLIVGHWTSSQGAPGAGKITIYSGRTGLAMRTITSTTAGENLGFDAVGIGDVNLDGMIDFLCSAASANRVYLIAGDIEPTVPGDGDGDGDVDLFDYETYLGCVTGPGAGGDGCEVFDIDFDVDIDFGDFGSLQESFTGECGIVVTQHPQDLETCLNGAAVLSVVAEGTNLSYVWRREGLELPGETGAMLVIDPVTPDDVGNYWVTVRSDCAVKNSQVAVLTLFDPPVVTADPENTSVCAGDAAQFTVEADGAEPLGYQWQFEGIDIPGAVEPTLVIKNAGPKDLGQYRCVVTDDCDQSITSATADLMFFANVEIVDQPVGGEFCVGDQVTLFVIDSGGVTYQWFKDDVPIDGATDFFLIIADAQTDDSGVYHVEVFGECDAALSEDAVVVVIDCGKAP